MTRPNSLLLSELLLESLENGKTPYLTITSGSMSPLIRKGDQIGLTSASSDQLLQGDVIVMRTNATFVTHRFWGQVNDQLITRGDRGFNFDPPWSPKALIGRVALVRRGKHLLSLSGGKGAWLNSHLWRLVQMEDWLLSGSGYNPLSLEQDGGSVRRAPRVNQRSWPARFVRRARYGWALLLTTLIAGSSQRMGKKRYDARIDAGAPVDISDVH